MHQKKLPSVPLSSSRTAILPGKLCLFARFAMTCFHLVHFGGFELILSFFCFENSCCILLRRCPSFLHLHDKSLRLLIFVVFHIDINFFVTCFCKRGENHANVFYLLDNTHTRYVTAGEWGGVGGGVNVHLNLPHMRVLRHAAGLRCGGGVC